MGIGSGGKWVEWRCGCGKRLGSQHGEELRLRHKGLEAVVRAPLTVLCPRCSAWNHATVLP